MEHLSKIELIGIVGAVHEGVYGNERNVRFSVAVNQVFKGGAGSAVKTTWFQCNYWGNAVIEKGQTIHLDGRMLGNEYTDQDGNTRTYYEVKVGRIW